MEGGKSLWEDQGTTPVRDKGEIQKELLRGNSSKPSGHLVWIFTDFRVNFKKFPERAVAKKIFRWILTKRRKEWSCVVLLQEIIL